MVTYKHARENREYYFSMRMSCELLLIENLDNAFCLYLHGIVYFPHRITFTRMYTNYYTVQCNNDSGSRHCCNVVCLTVCFFLVCGHCWSTDLFCFCRCFVERPMPFIFIIVAVFDLCRTRFNFRLAPLSVECCGVNSVRIIFHRHCRLILCATCLFISRDRPWSLFRSIVVH